MAPFIVLSVQCVFSLLIFSLLAKWYVIPAITKKHSEILALLLIVNLFRYLPLSLFMPGQVSSNFPLHIKEIVAYGDFISAFLALIALITFKSGSKSAKYMVWFFSIISIIDMMAALSFAMASEIYDLNLGTNYFTVSVYVPLLIVAQALILNILLKKSIKI